MQRGRPPARRDCWCAAGVTSHQHALPDAAPGDVSWGMRAVFPLNDSLILRWIAEAKSER